MLLDVDWTGARAGWLGLSALSCISISVLLIASSILYDLFFHPLHNIPGPVWGKFTRFPFWISGLMGNQHRFMHGLHQKYGSVVRFSPDELSYTDAQAWKDIHGYQKGREENQKTQEFQ